MKYPLTLRHALLAGCALSLVSTPALAQDAEEETARTSGNVIIVTATKRDSTIQDVPFSINAQTEEAIIRSGSTSLEDLSRKVAGLSIQNLGPGQSQVSVRGASAGQVVRDQPGVKEQVGVYLDESVISLSLFTPDLDLFDLVRVETLRGPQGTLFGSGSVGGEDVNDGERYGGRLAVTFAAGDSVTITPRIIYQKIEAGGFNRQEIFNLYYNEFQTTPGIFNEREQYLQLREAFEDETLIADLVAEVDLSGVTLTSVTSYTDRKILVSRDASALTGSVSVDLGYPDAGVLLPSSLRDTTDLEGFSQEIRLSSDDAGPLQ